MCSILLFREASPPKVNRFDEYCAAVEARFCPYLKSSHLKSTSKYTTLGVSNADQYSLSEYVFNTSLFLIQLVKQQGYDNSVVSENIVLGEGDLESQWLKRLAWMLKWIYTGDRIMIGKFLKGDEEISRHGHQMPPIPLTYLSFRPATIERDLKFYGKSPKLKPVFEAGEPDCWHRISEHAGDIKQLVFSQLEIFRENPSSKALRQGIQKLSEVQAFERCRKSIYQLT